MASAWQSKTLADLLPANIATLIGAAGPVVSTVSTLTGNVATLASTLSALVIDFIDPIDAATSAFINDVAAFVQDLQNTGVSVLVVPAPRTAAETRGTAEFISEVEKSLFDFGDPNRPTFTPTAIVGGVVVLIGAPSLQGLATVADALGKVLQLKELRDLQRVLTTSNPSFSTSLTGSVKGALAAQDIPVTSTAGFLPADGAVVIDKEVITYREVTASEFKGAVFTQNHTAGALVRPALLSYIDETPDWSTKRVFELFPPVAAALSALERLTQKLAASVRASAAVTAFAALLSAKASALSALASELSTALTNLTTDFNATGVNVLVIPEGVGGNARFLSELRQATNQPAFSSSAYTAGIVIMGGAGSVPVLEVFFG